MALNFPSAPSANATYTYSGKSWTYNGNAWALTTATLSTSVVPEGNNLYYTNARARAAISVSGSGSYDNSTGIITITGGSSYGDSNVALLGYATNANVALKANIADLKTANVAELTNLYFTNARATAAVTNSSLSNVTISASSSSDALRITQTGAGNALVVEDSANPDSTPFIVTADGSVGVGTSSMTGKFNATGSSGGISAYLTDAVNSSLVVRNALGGVILGTDSGGQIHLATNGNTTAERRLSIDASGNVTFTTATAAFSANVTAGNVTLSSGGALTFPDGSRQTTAASVSGTLLNIITRSSNVGITLQNRTFSVQGRSSNTTITVA